MTGKTALNPQDEMRLLCKMTLETSFDDLPEEVVSHAKRSVLDTLAVTMGGSALEGIGETVALVKDRGGREDSYIPFYGGKIPASEAALAIAPMARALDFGDIHLLAGHCSEYTLPTLLAATGLKANVSGKEFLSAFIVGNEVLLRTAMITRLDRTMSYGHIGGHYIFGCVAAVGRLLGLTQEELENAQGIASSMTQPHSFLMFSPATLAIPIHSGFVGQDAVNACLLARKGITGPREGLLSSMAGYSGFVDWKPDLDLVVKDLGKTWNMMNIIMKRYPMTGFTQTSIDGLLRQRNNFDFKAADIEKIHIQMPERFAVHVIAPDRKEKQWHPETEHDFRFSLPYGVAAAAWTGDVFLDDFTESARSRRDVRDLMTRISVEASTAVSGFGARITTTLKSGKQHTNEYMYPKGHYEYPLEDQDLVEKFKKSAPYAATPVPDSVADSVSDAILEIEKVNDIVGAIIAPLTPK